MIGFKEWALVCDALGRGEQSIILRKGGVAEGREGFRFKHDEFLLFPTLFHEQAGRTKLPAETPLPKAGEGVIRVQYLARVEWTERIADAAVVAKLAPYHIWSDAEIDARFRHGDAPGLNLAFLRVFRIEPAFSFADSPKFGGCRSWVELPDLPPGTKLVPVLDDATHAKCAEAVKGISGGLV
jgi:hypothetical protein